MSLEAYERDEGGKERGRIGEGGRKERERGRGKEREGERERERGVGEERVYTHASASIILLSPV